MAGVIKVRTLGAKGVNVVKTPLQLDDDELVSGKNAQFYREQGLAGLRDRSGLVTHTLSALGASANGGVGLPLPAPGSAGGSPLFVARKSTPSFSLAGTLAFTVRSTTATGITEARDFAYAPGLGRWVTVGDAGAVLTSDDAGQTWVLRQAAEANNWRAVAFNGAQFVAVANNGTHQVMTSPDGIVWTVQTAAEANLWQSVCWASALNLWVAVASNGTHRVMTSPDGVTWTARTASAAKPWDGVCWSPSLALLCAVAADSGSVNNVMTSPDGITWTSQVTAAGPTYQRGAPSGSAVVVWSEDIALFAWLSFNTGSNHWQVTTSPDGVTWTDQTIPDPLVAGGSIVAAAGLFIVFQQAGFGGQTNTYLTSSNGSTWTTNDTGQSGLWFYSGAAVDNGILMLVAWNDATNSQILRGTVAVTNSGKQWIKSADFAVTWNPDSTLSRALDPSPRSLRTQGGVTIYLGAVPGTILGWDGTREYAISRLPSPSTVPVRSARLLCANGATIYAVSDDGTSQLAFAVNVVSGSATAIGALLTLANDDLVAGVFYSGRLWVSSRNRPLDQTKTSHIYSLRPLAETSWTTERSSVISAGSNKYQYGDLGAYGGFLFAAANTGVSAASIIEKRTPGGTWSTALTGPDSAAGDQSQFALLRGLPSFGFFAAYYDAQSGADHTGRMYFTGDGVTFVNEFNYLSAGGVGAPLGSWMMANFVFITVGRRVFQRSNVGIWTTVDSDTTIAHGLILGS